MKNKANVKNSDKKIIFITILCLIIALAFSSIYLLNKNTNIKEQVIGKIYFNKPVSWENSYAYLYNNKNNEFIGEWPGVKLKQEKDYIYYIEITNRMLDKADDIYNCNIIFNNGINRSSIETYKIEETCSGYNKIYNIISGLGTSYEQTKGEWLEYSENIEIGKIPTTERKVKNIIYMIGDGMGENHIIAGQLYKEDKFNIQKIKNKSYVKTSSKSVVTDSAAAATALATGHKTINETIGKDAYGNDVQNLMEYAKLKNLRTGIVCTQILNHATPAGFSVHNALRYNYDEIAQEQIKSNINLMFGGGREFFKKYEEEMLLNNYKWVNDISELKSIDKNSKVIGTFADNTISEEDERIGLSDMTKIALPRLENNNGFLLMIEGSDIDTYSHEGNINKMLNEMVDFDNAVGVAMQYVDNHPDTLLIVTADHETGGLTLDGVTSKEQLTDELFKVESHTSKDVALYAYGQGAEDITKYNIIDNTSIYKFMVQALANNYQN